MPSNPRAARASAQPSTVYVPVEVAERPAMRVKRQPRHEGVRIARLAGAQHGVVARWQLLEIGLSTSAIGRLIETGRLHPVHAGVFAVGHAVSRNTVAGWRPCWRRGAVLSHHSAAQLWGLRDPRSGSIDVTLASKSHHIPGIKRHSSLCLPTDEVTAHHGVPATSVPRTTFDLAAGGDVDLVENLVRRTEQRRELCDRLSLHDLLARYPRRRGCRTVRAALKRIEESPGGATASPLEERFLPFLRAHGLPIPRLNEWIDLGERRYKVDCRWPGTKEIVELDSWSGHGTRSAFRDDRERDRRLRVAGYALTRITWAQLDDEPAAVAADLRSLLPTYKRL